MADESVRYCDSGVAVCYEAYSAYDGCKESA